MRNFTYIFLFLIIAACNRSNSDGEVDDSKDYPVMQVDTTFLKALREAKKDENPKNYKAYVVIPNAGCSGCITQTETLLKKYIHRSNKVKFILTNVESLKELQIKIGVNFSKSPNVIIDKKNFFYKGILASIYPKVYFVNDAGHIYRALDVSPFQDGLGELKKLN